MTTGAAQPPAKKARGPSFVDSFWSSDYAGGLGVLFTKLQQGVIENQQILSIATMRAEAEELYSERLGDIAPTIDRMHGGFTRDDGASTRKAYEGVRGEMVEATKNHQKIASNIRELVVNPFSRWCDAHAQRVQNSQDDLQSKIKAHDRQAEAVKKLRAAYYNKCRLVEDQEEENKFAFQDPQDKGKEKAVDSPKHVSPPPTIVVQEETEQLPVEIGDETYAPDQLKRLLAHMLQTIALDQTRVPILGVYENTSAGSDITQYIQKHMNASNIGYAENIGQDLVDRGFLRLIGNVGSTFANSSKMKYQWRPRAFQVSGVPDKKKGLGRASTVSSLDGNIAESPVVANLTETLQAWNPLNNPYPNETPPERLRREAKESDERYKTSVIKLDLLRCELEETMMTHLKFLERCETDRLKAIRSVILDFSGAISNSIPSFQSQVDHMMLYQETINPLGDLRYLLENYKTGPFIPKVTPYENYYGSIDYQVFGVDLEERARADKKRVPLIITALLTFLDNHYPDLDGDDTRRSIWLVDVPLAATHHLRNAINQGGAIPKELLERYEVPIVASVLKLYLLELPDSLVTSQVYEIIKTIYDTTSDATPNPISSEPINSAPRIKVLQSTLGQLKLNNIATLDAITTHFTRLIDLTSADDSYVASLAQVLAPCILRPRTVNALTMEERHPYRLVRDLFDHKEAIFGELKRQASSAASGGSRADSARQRAVSSTDESSRRSAMEARARAINNERQRAKSPVSSNRHRRDKSTDGSGPGRFPVVASPRPDGGRIVSGVKRGSLEVPGSAGSSPVSTRQSGNDHGTSQIPPPKLSAMTNLTAQATSPDSIAGQSIHNSDASKRDSTPTPTSADPIGAIEDGTMPGAFTSGPGPHIQPPMDDETGSSNAYSAPEDLQNRSSAGSLKRMSAAGGSGRRGPPSGRYGSLKSKSNLNLTGNDAPQQNTPGVQLEDRAMDDDFS